MKKIIACVKIQNDGDIIESLCRYYCSFCDGIIVADDRGSDDTAAILNSMVNEGLPVFVITDNDIDPGLSLYEQRQKLFHLAVDRYNADIVLPIDADEFLINTNGGSPRSVLESLDESVENHVFWRNYMAPSHDLDDNNKFFPLYCEKYYSTSAYKTILDLSPG